MINNIYQFSNKSIKGENIELSQYRGKVLLIVNTASQCGFTPQYEGLEELYRKYKSEGFEILAFPSNQFANQEPGDDESIYSFCSTNYHVSFQLFSKVEVNGTSADPLYKFLKNSISGSLGSTSIKWNFTKFLINREGRPLKRYSPMTTPAFIEADVVKLLKGESSL